MNIKEKYKEQREQNKDKTLVLLGTAVSCFEVDWEMENTEYWACGSAFGEAHDDIKKLDLGFEIHPMDQILLIAQERKVNYNKFNCPVYVQNAKHPISEQLINEPRTFPLNDMLEYVSEINGSKFFTSSFCYMLVYAAMMGYKDVRLHKVLLTSDGEYFLERPGVEYWIDLLGAKEKMEFFFPEDAEMWASNVMYGYEQRPNIWKIQSRTKYLWDVFIKHFYEIEALTGAMNRAGGILYMNDVSKNENIKKENIDKMLSDCKATIDNNTNRLKASREKYMQFCGALQTHNFMELRGY